MPYLPAEIKVLLDEGAPILVSHPGALNYLLTKECLQWPSAWLEMRLARVIRHYMDQQPLSYHLINDVMGALECCRREFERREGMVTRVDMALRVAQDVIYETIAVPYEIEAIKRNGDVYPSPERVA